MELCDVCGNEQEDGETYTCEGCGVGFCPECGNTYRLLCDECAVEEKEDRDTEEREDRDTGRKKL